MYTVAQLRCTLISAWVDVTFRWHPGRGMFVVGLSLLGLQSRFRAKLLIVRI